MFYLVVSFIISCFILLYRLSYHVLSCCIVYHIMFYLVSFIISCFILLYRLSYHVLSCCIVYHIMFYLVVSFIISCFILLYRLSYCFMYWSTIWPYYFYSIDLCRNKMSLICSTILQGGYLKICHVPSASLGNRLRMQHCWKCLVLSTTLRKALLKKWLSIAWQKDMTEIEGFMLLGRLFRHLGPLTLNLFTPNDLSFCFSWTKSFGRFQSLSFRQAKNGN